MQPRRSCVGHHLQATCESDVGTRRLFAVFTIRSNSPLGNQGGAIPHPQPFGDDEEDDGPTAAPETAGGPLVKDTQDKVWRRDLHVVENVVQLGLPFPEDGEADGSNTRRHPREPCEHIDEKSIATIHEEKHRAAAVVYHQGQSRDAAASVMRCQCERGQLTCKTSSRAQSNK